MFRSRFPPCLARHFPSCSVFAPRPPLTDAGPFLPSDEIESLGAEQNVPNALLLTQQERLRAAHRDGLLDRFFFVSLDATLKRMTDHMGMCERIKNTVFPGHYLQDPFENYVTDTPMTAISRTIEINLRQQLGETDLPEPLRPRHGVLM